MDEKMVTLEDLAELKEVMQNVMGEEEEGDLISSFGVLLDMDDDQLEILVPSFIQSFQQSVNNPNDRLVLLQALGATGENADDMMNTFGEIAREVDSMDFISETKKDFIKQMLGTLVNAIAETEGIAKRVIQIPVEFCHPDAKMPEYANISDSGMDLFALEDYEILPGETKLIPTGLKIALPPGYELQVRPKSGRALNTKLRVANSPGTIDAGYRDEIKVIVENIQSPIMDIDYTFGEGGKIIINSILHGSVFNIGKGEKFAQLVLMEVPKAALYQIDSVQEIGDDRLGGFGSTGLV